MDTTERPLSTLIGQGWELQGYTSAYDHSQGLVDCFLLRRHKQHKVLRVRKKTLGAGYVVKEIDV